MTKVFGGFKTVLYSEAVLTYIFTFSSQKNIIKLLEELGMETFYQYTSGFNKVFYKNRRNIKKYEGLIPPVGVLNLLNYWYLEQKVFIIYYTLV